MNLDLSAIEARVKRKQTAANPLATLQSMEDLCADIPDLIAEVRRLQAVEAGAAAMREALTVISADAGIVNDAWLKEQEINGRGGIKLVIENIRKHSTAALSTEAGAALLKERNELRELVENMRTKNSASDAMDAWDENGTLRTERDELRAKLAETVRERDEARTFAKVPANSTEAATPVETKQKEVQICFSERDAAKRFILALQVIFSEHGIKYETAGDVEDGLKNLRQQLTAARELADKMGDMAQRLELFVRVIGLTSEPAAKQAEEARAVIADWRAGK